MEKTEYRYMVGVQCMTFNQSQYITNTLNGFAMQQTNFPFIVMVVDDASTDGEQEVIEKYINEHFDVNDKSIAYEKETDYAHISYAQHKTNRNFFIVAMYLKENHYSQKKNKAPYLSEWLDNIKYESLCEGDDYWIHPQKLQIQVDFLEEHEEYGLVYGRSEIYHQDKNKFGTTIGKECGSLEELLISNQIITLTSMFRRQARTGFYDFINDEKERADWKMGDYPLWLYIARSYKIHFFNEVFGVYRQLEVSASSRNSFEGSRNFTKSALDISIFFAKKCNKEDMIQTIEQTFYKKMFNKAFHYRRKNDVKKYFREIKKHTCMEWIKYMLCHI